MMENMFGIDSDLNSKRLLFRLAPASGLLVSSSIRWSRGGCPVLLLTPRWGWWWYPITASWG